jgi:hypothetical protein
LIFIKVVVDFVDVAVDVAVVAGFAVVAIVIQLLTVTDAVVGEKKSSVQVWQNAFFFLFQTV